MRHYTIGYDPGGRDTGLVLVEPKLPRPALVAAVSVTREGDGLLAAAGSHAYATEIWDALDYWRTFTRRHPAHLLLAVESYNRPNPKVRITDPSPIFGTGAAAGIALAFATVHRIPLVWIAPNRHGLARPMSQHYPADLIGPQEDDWKGTGIRRHLRAAYDVAAAAPPLNTGEPQP